MTGQKPAERLAERMGMRVPVVAAPLGGGPSTPQLVAAVADAGGFGFLAAGYLPAARVLEQIEQTRALTRRPFGVNVFVPGSRDVDAAALEAYARELQPVAERLGVALGEPRWDDDEYGAKIDLLAAQRLPVVSFTFGCPAPAVVDRLHEAGTAVLVTVTSVSEAAAAVAAGADGLVAQGAEAGGHNAAFRDDPAVPPGAQALGLLPLLGQVLGAVQVPVIAAGGLMTGGDVAAVLTAGAVAAQLGTAFLCCPEAATSDAHREALLGRRFAATAMTRAFTGRSARGLVNGFLREHSDAPAGYPWVHHLTRPLRVAAAASGDADTVHLWAGQGWPLVRALPAAELVEAIAAEVHVAGRS